MDLLRGALAPAMCEGPSSPNGTPPERDAGPAAEPTLSARTPNATRRQMRQTGLPSRRHLGS